MDFLSGLKETGKYLMKPLPLVNPLMNLLGSQFKSTPEKFQGVSRFTPEQQPAFSEILQMALGGLRDPQAGFEPIAQRARSQFETQTLPSLIEQFTAGTPSGERSSAFQGMLSGAGTDLEERLASMQSQYGQRQQGLSQNLLGMGLTPQFDTTYQPSQQSGLTNFLSSYLAGGGGEQIGNMASSYFGGSKTGGVDTGGGQTGTDWTSTILPALIKAAPYIASMFL